MCHQGRNLRAPGGRQLYRAEGWKLEVRCLARPVPFQAQNCRERWQLGKGICAASGDGEDDRAVSESVGGLGGQMHGSSWAWDGVAKMQGDRKGRWEQGVGPGEQHGTGSASRVAMAERTGAQQSLVGSTTRPPCSTIPAGSLESKCPSRGVSSIQLGLSSSLQSAITLVTCVLNLTGTG